jgi:hypothetical protein
VVERWATIRAQINRHDETVVGVLIVLVTVFGAYVTWRAAAASGTASDLDQRGRQELILEQRRQSELRAQVSYEQNLFRAFEGHVALADLLEGDAAQVRDRDPALSRSLSAEAERERAMARSLQSWFYGYHLGRNFHPAYNADRELTSLVKYDQDLDELNPPRLEKAADTAREKRFWLVVVDTAAIAAIFFLTLALLGPRPASRPPEEGGVVRRRFAVAGAAIFVAAVCSFAVVQSVVEVPPS